MSSPDIPSFSQFIKIDRRKSDPIYLQIVYQFIQAVQGRLLEVGNKIPGSRRLSKDLNVHRKTIIAALDELQTQGWVTTVPSVGTFVENPDLNAKGNQNSRSEEHTSELQSRGQLVCRLLLEKKKK